jgi:hypothetical protein
MRFKRPTLRHKLSAALLSAIYVAAITQSAAGYAFNLIVPDVRQPASLSGGSACPVRAHQLSVTSAITLRWSTALAANPISILTQDQTASGRLSEIEQVISQSLAVYFAPGNPQINFATPAALPTSPQAYDLESVLTHELGHFLGFSHSAVWSAMMYPYAPAPGSFTAPRPTAQQPDAPLADDDRTGLRILYPDPADAANIGAISGRILPANPLSLPLSPPA